MKLDNIVNGPTRTQVEVAALLGITPETVCVTEKRAMKKLRAILSKRLKIDEHPQHSDAPADDEDDE